MCVCACVCVCLRACMCVCVCVYACMCVCVAKQVTVKLRCHATALIFSFMDSFVFKQQFFFRFDSLSVTLDHRAGGARGQNLGHLKKIIFFFAFIFLLCNQSYLKNRYYSGLTFSL